MTTSSPSATRAHRVRPSIWAGLVAVAVYVFFAAVVGNIVGDMAADDTAEFVLSHYVPLPIVIVLGLLFVRWAGWRGVFSETPTPLLRPRRLWLIAIPLLAFTIPIANLADVDWSALSIGTVLLIVGGVLMVGFGEELYVRGILLVGVRERHGELVTLLVTSFVFAAMHIVGSLWAGLPFAFIVFQVSALTLSGVTYYWIRRVTGRLWVGVLVHAFTDGVLYLGSGASRHADALADAGSNVDETFAVTVQVLLIVAGLASVLSTIREDRRDRTARKVNAR